MNEEYMIFYFIGGYMMAFVGFGCLFYLGDIIDGWITSKLKQLDNKNKKPNDPYR